MSAGIVVPARLRRGRRGAASGQALLEFAMFFLFMVLLLAGVTNVGGLLNAHINIEYATRQGARTGAVIGNQSNADCAIIGAVDAALVNEPNLTLNQITIYKAAADGSPVGVTYEDIYPGNTQCIISGGTPTLTQPATVSSWPPSARQNTPFFEDSIGVQLDYSYSFQFPMLGSGTFNSFDRTVMPINPVAVASPIPTPTALPTPTP